MEDEEIKKKLKDAIERTKPQKDICKGCGKAHNPLMDWNRFSKILSETVDFLHDKHGLGDLDIILVAKALVEAGDMKNTGQALEAWIQTKAHDMKDMLDRKRKKDGI